MITLKNAQHCIDPRELWYGKRERHWARCHSVRGDYCITVGKIAFICDNTQTSPWKEKRSGSWWWRQSGLENYLKLTEEKCGIAEQHLVPVSVYTRLARVEKTGRGVTTQYIRVFKDVFVLYTERERISSICFWNHFILLCCCWGDRDLSRWLNFSGWCSRIENADTTKENLLIIFLFFHLHILTSWIGKFYKRGWNFCSLIIFLQRCSDLCLVCSMNWR